MFIFSILVLREETHYQACEESSFVLCKSFNRQNIILFVLMNSFRTRVVRSFRSFTTPFSKSTTPCLSQFLFLDVFDEFEADLILKTRTHISKGKATYCLEQFFYLKMIMNLIILLPKLNGRNRKICRYMVSTWLQQSLDLRIHQFGRFQQRN